MKRAYLIFPLVTLTAFAGYYAYWTHDRAEVLARDPYAGRDGRKEAEADIFHGMPKLLAYGKPSGATEELAVVLKQRFGVELDRMAACVVTAPLQSFVVAYNDVIRRHIATKFGPAALGEADSDAQRLWEIKK